MLRRQTKRGPVYIWHADIDAGARIAVDIATDFIPGVSHAKDAYDAYSRIQNGEDPVEVLAAAGAAAALGLIPGLKAARKIDKVLDKAEDVADAAGDVVSLADRAQEVHGALHPVAQRMRTTAALETSGGRIIAGGGPDLTPAQRALLGPGETAARLPGAHAEVTALSHAQQTGLAPHSMAVTRPICAECAARIEASGGTLTSPTTAAWSR